MAIIENDGTGEQTKLRGRTLVGRSPDAALRLSGVGASTEQASIYWTGSEWILRDLSSRNGTKVNDTLLIGREWRLSPGDLIVFGDPDERWRWVEGSSPQAIAVSGDVTVEAVHGILLLPDPETPLASVFARENTWEFDMGEGVRTVRDGDTVSVAGLSFRLSLPRLHPMADRTRAFDNQQDLTTARATFGVSLDEEHVELTLETRTKVLRLSHRSFFYMLLTLARSRNADIAGGIPRAEAGWVYADQLADRLGTELYKLNVDVHRARRMAAEVGLFSNPEELIQRRRGSGQVRLGFEEVIVREGQPNRAAR